MQPNDSDTTDLDRRAVLKATSGAVGVGLLAGCTGEVDEGDGSTEEEDRTNDNGESDDEDDFPERDIRSVIPYGPGGGYDEYTRLVAPYLEEYLPNNVNVVVQNITGADGEIGTSEVYNATGDAHEKLIVNLDAFSRQQVGQNVGYDLTEMSHYCQVAEDFRAITVGTDTDIYDWDDLVNAIQNEEVRFGGTGLASGDAVIAFMTGEISGLWPAENVLDNFVVYDGRGDHVSGIARGDVQVLSGSYYSVLPYIQDNTVRPIAVCTSEDEPPEETPDVPTYKNLGIENHEEIVNVITGRRIFSGPPELPEQHYDIMHDALQETLNDDELLADTEEINRPIAYEDGEAATQSIETAIEKWSEYSDLLELISGDD